MKKTVCFYIVELLISQMAIQKLIWLKNAYSSCEHLARECLAGGGTAYQMGQLKKCADEASIV